MMRRSRIAVRPNVKPGGRGLTSTRDAQPVWGSTNDAPDRDEAPQSSGTEAGGAGVQKGASDQPDEKECNAHSTRNTHCSQPAKASCSLDGKHQNGEATACSNLPVSSWQRRNRFCVIPNLTKTRMTAAPARSSHRTPRSPAAKAVASPTAEVAVAESEGQLQLNSNSSQALRSPNRQRASSCGKQPKIQSRPGPLSSASKNQSDSPQGRKLVSKTTPCLVGLSTEVVERQQEAAPSHSRALTSEPSPVTPKLLQGIVSFTKVHPPLSTLTSRNQIISFERERIVKANKLRELLKREWRKERKHKKSKSLVSECNTPQDRNKMTMADLIHYLPDTNPMKSYFVEEIKRTEKVVPSSPCKNLHEDPPENEVEDDRHVEDADNDPAQDAQLAVPRVKVAEDGSLIIDEESLTVEVSRVKGPNTVEENDPIFERGSSTTYSSFRKTSYTKPWSDKETDMFFLAISMVGTDFSMIGQLFPHRERAEIKNKFKKEERTNSWRIDKAFREKRRLDLNYFNTLLKKTLAEEDMKREKSKPYSHIKRKMERKPSSKQKGKVFGPTDQTAEEEMDNEVAEVDSETAEKENEDCTNVIGSANEDASFQKKHKSKPEELEDSSSEKHTNGRRPINCSNDDDDVVSDLVTETPASNADAKRLEIPDRPEVARKGPVIKPAQLSRGRLQKPIPNLERHWAKKLLGITEKPCNKAKAGCEQDQEVGVTEAGAEAKEYVENKPRQSKRQAGGVTCLDDDDKDEDTEDELDLMAMQEQMLNKPTRSGRIPKISQVLQQAGEEDSPDETSSTSPPPQPKASPKQQRRRANPKPNLDMSKRNRGVLRSKLVTLRALLPEDCEEEEQSEARPEETYSYPINPEEQNQAPAFVPLSLRSPEPVRLEVEESMEELEISVNVPDVLDVAETQDSLCSQSECPGVQEEVTVTTEHQLDLLVDVMEYLSPEHEEVVSNCEESSNEAARTLLTIRNPELFSLATSTCHTEASIPEEPTLKRPEREEATGTADKPEHIEQTLCVAEPSHTMTCDLSDPSSSDRANHPQPESTAHLDMVQETYGSDDHLIETSCPPPSCQESNICASSRDAEVPSSDFGSFPKAPQIRKSRFAKPRPNLGGITRTCQVQLIQSTVPTSSEDAADFASSPVFLKPFEEEKSNSESIAKDNVLEESKDEGASVKKTDERSEESVNSQEGAQSSDALPPRTREPQSRRSRFPKPKPNLDRATRNPQRATSQTHSAPNTGTGRPTEETPAKAKSTDTEAVKTSMSEAQLKEGERPRCKATVEEQQATNLHTDEDLVFTPSDTAEAEFNHQEPTIILTLFQIPSSQADEYEPSSVPVRTVTAELLSPLMFVDAQSEPQSRDHLTASGVQMAAGCSSMSHFMVSDPLEEHGGEKCHAERSDDLCEEEEDISLSLVPVEESCGPLDPGSEEAGVDAVPPLKKRRIAIKTRRGKSKPGPSESAPVNPREGERVDLGDEPAAPISFQMSFQEELPTAATTPAWQSLTQPQKSAAAELQQGVVGHADPLQQNTDTTVTVEKVNSSGEKEPEPNYQIPPLALDGPLTRRPGRKPRGFLSFISSKTSTGSAGIVRMSRPTSQRPLVNTARVERRRSSAASVGTATETPAINDTCSKVMVISSQGGHTHNIASPQDSESPPSEISCAKQMAHKADSKEPTNVTEYFFSDIFTEVGYQDGHQP